MRNAVVSVDLSAALVATTSESDIRSGVFVVATLESFNRSGGANDLAQGMSDTVINRRQSMVLERGGSIRFLKGSPIDEDRDRMDRGR